ATSFTIPLAALIIVLIFKSLAKRDPLRKNYERFRRTYEVSLDLAILLALGTHLLLLSLMLVLQTRFPPVRFHWITYVPTTLLGVVLLVLGNILPRLRPNSAMGVRTRWALADETVWTKTHRAAGYVLVVFGLALIAWTFIDFQDIWWVLGPGAIVTAAGLPLYSYLSWRRSVRNAAAEPVGSAKSKEAS
ncbi:MAG TPA: SdpI family protein, partial [Acidobacteriota bacterium]|nr:SdpI family protein [Acidobacteriota bacterium]